MPYIDKHRPFISQRIKFRPSPYTPRAIISHQTLFKDLKSSASCISSDSDSSSDEQRMVPAIAWMHTPQPSSSDGGMEPLRQRVQTPKKRTTQISMPGDNLIDRVGQRRQGQHVTIQEPSDDSDKEDPVSAPSTQPGTMCLRSNPPKSSKLCEPSPAIIKKPREEPGCPRSNGHNVEEELLKLNWSKDQYNALYISRNEHLSLSLTYAFVHTRMQ